LGRCVFALGVGGVRSFGGVVLALVWGVGMVGQLVGWRVLW